MPACVLCACATSRRCSRCHAAYYCSDVCARTAWPAHKGACKNGIIPAPRATSETTLDLHALAEIASSAFSDSTLQPDYTVASVTVDVRRGTTRWMARSDAPPPLRAYNSGYGTAIENPDAFWLVAGASAQEKREAFYRAQRAQSCSTISATIAYAVSRLAAANIDIVFGGTQKIVRFGRYSGTVTPERDEHVILCRDERDPGVALIGPQQSRVVSYAHTWLYAFVAGDERPVHIDVAAAQFGLCAGEGEPVAIWRGAARSARSSVTAGATTLHYEVTKTSDESTSVATYLEIASVALDQDAKAGHAEFKHEFELFAMFTRAGIVNVLGRDACDRILDAWPHESRVVRESNMMFFSHC
jgi:hypothetical protein